MKALILAAGRGHRLQPFTRTTPKCLLPVEAHETILQRQVRLLTQAGVDRIVVVAGFGFPQVQAALAHDHRVRVIYNPFHEVADNLISLWAARSHMDEDLLIVNGDNVFHPDLPRHLLQPIAPDCQLLVQYKDSYDDDDMKVRIRAGLLQRIGKDLPAGQIDAESVGLLSFRGRGVEHLHAILEEAVQAERAMSSYYLDGIQRLASGGIAIHCVDTGTLPWADVDTPSDLVSVRHNLDHFVRLDGVDATHRSTRLA